MKKKNKITGLSKISQIKRVTFIRPHCKKIKFFWLACTYHSAFEPAATVMAATYTLYLTRVEF